MHQIQPEYGDEQADAGRDCRNLSPETKFRLKRGQRNVIFPCSTDHEQNWQPYPVDPYPERFSIGHTVEDGGCFLSDSDLQSIRGASILAYHFRVSRWIRQLRVPKPAIRLHTGNADADGDFLFFSDIRPGQLFFDKCSQNLNALTVGRFGGLGTGGVEFTDQLATLWLEERMVKKRQHTIISKMQVAISCQEERYRLALGERRQARQNASTPVPPNDRVIGATMGVIARWMGFRRVLRT